LGGEFKIYKCTYCNNKFKVTVPDKVTKYKCPSCERQIVVNPSKGNQKKVSSDDNAEAKELKDDKHGMKILKELSPDTSEKKDENGRFGKLDNLYESSLVEEVKAEKNEKAKRIVEQFNRLKQAVLDRDKDIENLKSEIVMKDKELMGTSDAFDEDMEKISNQLEEKEGEIKALNEKIKELEASVEEAKAGSLPLKQDILDLEGANDALMNERDESIKAAKEAERNYKDINSSNVKLNGKVASLKEENAKLDKMVLELQGNVSKLLKKLEDHTELKHKEIELEKREKKLLKITSTLDAKKEDITEKYKKFTQEVKETNKKMDQYEKDVKKFEKEQAVLDRMMEDFGARDKELAQKEKVAKNNSTVLDKKAEELLKKEEELRALEEREKEDVEELNQKINDLQELVDTVTKERDEVTDALESAQNMCADLEKLNKVHEEIEHEADAIADAEVELLAEAGEMDKETTEEKAGKEKPDVDWDNNEVEEKPAKKKKGKKKSAKKKGGKKGKKK
jgi:chromosome segregation ATPase